jgi:hypothetical protein
MAWQLKDTDLIAYSVTSMLFPPLTYMVMFSGLNLSINHVKKSQSSSDCVAKLRMPLKPLPLFSLACCLSWFMTII